MGQGSGGGQRHPERRSPPGTLGADPDASVHRLGEGADDREADPGAALGARPRGVDAVEPLEYVRSLLGREARTLVTDGDENLAALAGDDHVDGRAVRRLSLIHIS